VYAIVISTILGTAFGFGLSYYTFDSEIQRLTNELDSLSSAVNNLPIDWTKADILALSASVAQLQDTVDNLTSREWHKIYTIIGTSTEYADNKTITDTFQVKGKSILIQLEFDGWVTGYFEVGLHHSNGTFHSVLSRLYLPNIRTFSEIPIRQPGNYYLNVTVGPYWGWNISVWDYY
jgi:hypothetical protein